MTKGKKRKLNRGTLKCPECKKPLFFELLQGMRIIDESGNYNAICEPCQERYTVKT